MSLPPDVWWDGGMAHVPFAGSGPSPDAGVYINNTAADLFDHYRVGWSTWVPTHTDITVGNGTEYCRQFTIGGRVHMTYVLTFGSTTTIGTRPTVRNAAATLRTRYMPGAVGCWDDSNSRWHPVAGYGGTSDQMTFYVAATFPFTWTTGDVLSAEWVAKKQPGQYSVGE